jgi:hypothetical protein
VNGGSTTFDAPLLTPKSAEPARIAAHRAIRTDRVCRFVVRNEMSDIATEYIAAFDSLHALDEMHQRDHS